MLFSRLIMPQWWILLLRPFVSPEFLYTMGEIHLSQFSRTCSAIVKQMINTDVLPKLKLAESSGRCWKELGHAVRDCRNLELTFRAFSLRLLLQL